MSSLHHVRNLRFFKHCATSASTNFRDACYHVIPEHQLQKNAGNDIEHSRDCVLGMSALQRQRGFIPSLYCLDAESGDMNCALFCFTMKQTWKDSRLPRLILVLFAFARSILPCACRSGPAVSQHGVGLLPHVSLV